MSDEVEIRRARRGDLPAIAGLVQKASRSKHKVDEAEVMDWLFSKGLWVAIAGDTLVGVTACQTENLVSVTDLFYVAPASWRDKAGGPLLAAIEAEVYTLMCEANVLLLPDWAPKAIRTYLQKQGYEPKSFQDLHRIWREVLSGFEIEGMGLMIKRLRERMVMAPL